MKRIIFVPLVLVSLMLLASTCREEGHQFITFKNLSDRDIEVQELWSLTISNADSLFQCNIVSLPIPVGSFRQFESVSRVGGWERDFVSLPFIQFLVMDGETFDKYNIFIDGRRPEGWCDTIRKNVPILYRYRLTLEDLQRMDFTITFP